MRFDTLTEFSVAQSLTGASADSTNTLDLGSAVIAEGQAFVVATILTDNDDDAAVELKGSDDNSTLSPWQSAASRQAKPAIRSRLRFRPDARAI